MEVEWMESPAVTSGAGEIEAVTPKKVLKSPSAKYPISQSTSCHHTDHRLPPGPPPRPKKHPTKEKIAPFWFQTNVPRIRKALPQPVPWSSVYSAHNHSGQTGSRASEVAAVLARPPPPRTRSLGGSERPAEPRPAGGPTPKVSVTATTAPSTALHSSLNVTPAAEGAGGRRGPAPPALPPPGPRRLGVASGARRHGPNTLPRSARPPAAPEPGSPAERAPPRAGRAGSPVARPSPGAEGAGRGPRVARSHEQQGAPARTGPARGETVTRVTSRAPAAHRLAPRLPPRRRRSSPPAAAALSQPQAPPGWPILQTRGS